MAKPPRRPRGGARMLSVAAFPTAAPRLARLPLPRQEALLMPRRRRRYDAARAEWVASNVDRVLAASHPVVRTRRPPRGLTPFYFLRRAGVDVKLSHGLGEINGRME